MQSPFLYVRYLGIKKHCYQQYIYMQLEGDYPFQKDLMTTPCTHAWQFKEMIRTNEALPAGNWPKPLEALTLE
jgi:hypothetical protein